MTEMQDLHLHQLYRLSLEVGSSLELEHETEAFVTWLVHATRPALVALFVLDETHHHMELVASYGFSPLSEASLDIGLDVWRWLAQHGVHIPEETHRRYAVPIAIEQQLHGVVCVVSRAPEWEIERERQLVSTAASFLAPILRNISVYRQLEDLVAERTRELEEANRALRAEVAERRQVERALREREEQYRSLFDGAPVGLYRTDAQGHLLEVNAAMAAMLKYPGRHVLVGLHFQELCLTEHDRDLWCAQLEVQEANRVREVELRLRCRDGSTIWVVNKGQPICDHRGHPVFYEGSLVDITARKEAEEALRRQIEELSILHMLATLCAEATDEDTLIEEATRLIGERLYTDNFGILLLDEEAGVLRPHASYRASTEVINFSVPLGRGVTGHVAVTGRPKRVPDVEQEPNYIRIETRTRSELCVPLRAGNRVLGVINAESVRVNAFTEEDERLLITFAGQLATAIERLRSQEAERRRTQQLTTIYEVSRQVTSILSPDELLPEIVRRIGVALYLESIEIWLVRNEGLVRAAAYGAGFGVLRAQETHPALADKAAIKSVALSGRPFTQTEQPTGHRRFFVPLRGRGQVIGVLAILAGAESSFHPEDLALFETLADQIAIAIHNARLFAETERRLQRLTALRYIDMTIASNADLHLTMRTLIDQTLTHLKVDAADILLFDPHMYYLEYAAGNGFQAQHPFPPVIRLYEDTAGEVVLQRQRILLSNFERAISFPRREQLDNERFVYYCGVPLIAKGELKGVLEIFHRTILNPDGEWFEFLEMLASQLAIAIDNAHLFENLHRANVELRIAYDATLEGWVRALDMRDQETEGHTQRVTELTVKLARQMGIHGETLGHIRRGALLHDVGKIAIPDSILRKPGPLTPEEWEIMRQHPVYAYDLLSPIEYLRPALDIPYCHHERWDGSGYPRGLQGLQIPLPARIFAVVDVWDALRSNRPYRPAWPEEKALRYIREQAGKHFDRHVVAEFLKLLAKEKRSP
ncbi:MAG: GAF domain-containing protein [Ardenticatenia bacterium]|nr:GAF domain-containing protein [Ardenticatenia bacterium]